MNKICLSALLVICFVVILLPVSEAAGELESELKCLLIDLQEDVEQLYQKLDPNNALRLNLQNLLNVIKQVLANPLVKYLLLPLITGLEVGLKALLATASQDLAPLIKDVIAIFEQVKLKLQVGVGSK